MVSDISHHERLDAARDTVRYICGRNAAEMKLAVPNCPGWTVYNAAVHVGRVGIAWHAMIEAGPDDPDSRTRGYADAESRGEGHEPEVLASWAFAAIDALEDDVDRPCYFSMTGGSGTVGLWGWHAASELAVHRLDIEDAVGAPHLMSDALACDAIEYAAQYFLPAMTRVTNTAPGAMSLALTLEDGTLEAEQTADLVVQAHGSDAEPAAGLAGRPVDILLALWGRPHGPIAASGDPAVTQTWFDLPSQAFQFGTWD